MNWMAWNHLNSYQELIMDKDEFGNTNCINCVNCKNCIDCVNL